MYAPRLGAGRGGGLSARSAHEKSSEPRLTVKAPKQDRRIAELESVPEELNAANKQIGMRVTSLT